MAANTKKTETMIGVFLFLGLSFLGAIILLFGNLGDFFKDRYEIKVNFSEAAGVIKGSSVRLRGAKVGKVAEKPVLLGGDQIQVILAIDSDHRIEKGSIFRIETASLLGDKEIVIIPPPEPAQEYLEAGAVIEGGGPGGLDRLQNEAEGIARDTREVFQEAKRAMSEIEKSVKEIRGVTSRLTVTLDKVNDKILSDENLESVSGSLTNLEKATGSFAKVGDDLGPVVTEVRGTISEIRESNQMLQGAIQRVDPALEGIPEVIASIKGMVATAKEALEKIQDNEGVLGTLVSDEELKEDFKVFVRNLKEKGILGYKDDETDDEDLRDRLRERRR